MESSLQLSNIAALFGAMALLAAIPSVSVLAVTAKSASSGFVHGVFTAVGIVVGDIIFILLAVFGLVLLAETFGSLFFHIQYIGGAYLIWLGVLLWRSRSRYLERRDESNGSLFVSFMTGLLITLGDQKAILFYLGFFPAFLDLAALTRIDIVLLVVITLFAVGGVKLGYALAADRAGLLLGNRMGARLNVIAACIMIITGILIIVRS